MLNRILQTIIIFYFSDTYRPEFVLELCERHQITDVRVYLLESMNRHTDAFTVLFSLLVDKTAQCVEEGLEKFLKRGRV